MCKEDLAREVTDILNLPHPWNMRSGLGMKIVNAITTAMRDALLRGESVKVVGFGTFKRAIRPSRRTRVAYSFNRKTEYGGWKNPEIITIPERPYIKFTPSRTILRKP